MILGVVSEERLSDFKTDKYDYVDKAGDLYRFCLQHVKPEDLSCEWNVFIEMRDQLGHSLGWFQNPDRHLSACC